MGSSIDDTRKMISDMTTAIEGQDLPGLSLEEIEDAMSHPLAAETVAKLLPLEKTSVQEGEPAPDFTLAYLADGGDVGQGQTVTLSQHFGNRPVALIFGSYT